MKQGFFIIIKKLIVRNRMLENELKKGQNRSVYLNVQILKKLEVIKNYFNLTARNAAIMKCINVTYDAIQFKKEETKDELKNMLSSPQDNDRKQTNRLKQKLS